MPDGVNIPGGPSFAGTPQPPDVPCDPTGEGWRGPPGPAGTPGAPGAPGPAGSLAGGTMTGPLYWTATGSTASRAAQDRSAAAYNLKDFGSANDGTTDDAFALNAAIAAIVALPHGGKLILPAGRTVIGSAIIANIPAGVALTIEGIGPQASQLYFSNVTNGLGFTLLNSGNAWGAVNLHGFTLVRGSTSPAIASTGVRITADPAVAKMCQVGMSFRDLIIQGSVPVVGSQWLNGLILDGVSGCSLDNVGIYAQNGSPTDLGDVSLTINGASAAKYAVSNNLVNCIIQGGSCGINVTGYVQGVFVTNSTVIGNYDSIRWVCTNSAFAPEEMAIANVTLNARHRGIYTSLLNQLTVTGTTILHFNVGGAIDFAGIEVNQGFLNSIVGNNVVGAYTGTEVGIIFSDCGSSANTCIGNMTTNITGTGIVLSGSTANVAVIGNVFTVGSASISQNVWGSVILGNSWNGSPLTLSTTQPVVFRSTTPSGAARWFVGNDGTTEGSGNTGNDFEIVSASNTGSLLGTPLSIKRSNSIITMQFAPVFTNLPANFANDAAAAATIPVGGVYRNGSVLMVRVT